MHKQLVCLTNIKEECDVKRWKLEIDGLPEIFFTVIKNDEIPGEYHLIEESSKAIVLGNIRKVPELYLIKAMLFNSLNMA